MKGLAFLGCAGLLMVLLAFNSDEVDRGRAVFSRSCAVCHQGQEQGGKVPERFERFAGRQVPPLLGPQALLGFQTAGELFAYVQAEMPLDDPGSLTDQAYLDLTAWMLRQHGLEPNGTPLTPENAEKIRLPHSKK